MTVLTDSYHNPAVSMHKLLLSLLLFVSQVTHATDSPLIGRLASTPVQPFNQQIRTAQSQPWVMDYRQVARRFIGQSVPDAQIQSQPLGSDMVLTITLAGTQGERLYLLTLYRQNRLWLLRHAETGWLCQDEPAYRPFPCPPAPSARR